MGDYAAQVHAAWEKPQPRAGEPVLVLTKLFPPRPRPGHVPRPQLVEELRRGAAGRITLVRAPAGGGKTTLLSEWLATEQRAIVGWVSLDRDDDDPVRFWTYAIEALRVGGLPAPAELVRDLGAPGTRAGDVVLPRLVNLLAELDGRVVLALDDLHEVTSDDVYEDLRLLIERMPGGVHVCVASRAEPPEALGLARLRARGELTEIRAQDLRFDVDQAARLLAAAVGRDLERANVERLQERTEGWAAGLYLAGLSLRGRGAAAPLGPDDISGDDRHLADYLTTEILGGLESRVRSFLLRTSILGRLCGPLCDRVLETAGAARVLDAIERSNLLVVALDNRRMWFRYHHLFGDLLRRELQREIDPSELHALHRRASGWWEEHGDIREAIHHALAAGEVERAADLVSAHWNGYLERGQLATARAWLDALDPELVEARGDLLLARGWVELNSGRPEAASRAADAAEASDDAPTPPGLPPVEAGVPMLRAVISYMGGDLRSGADSARRALAVAHPESPWTAVAWALLGASLLWRPTAGDDADEALSRAIARSAPGENMIAVLHAYAAQGLLRLDGGERDAAIRALERAREVRHREGLGEYSWASLASALEGRLLEDRGELERAAANYARAVTLALRGRIAPEHAYALIRLARVRLARADSDGAREALREARRVLAACPEPGVLVHALSAAEHGTPLDHSPDAEPLTEREVAVLRMLASSLTQPEVAAALYVSVNTLKTHVRTIYRKLGARSREEAVAQGRARGVL